MINLLTCGILCGLMLIVVGSNDDETKFCSWHTGVQCRKNEFLCLNGEKCIGRGLYCNGKDDCGDNSDERYCNTKDCPVEQLASCKDWKSKCIPKNWFCDGFDDCGDYSDERSYNCKYGSTTTGITSDTERSWTAVNKVKQWVSEQRNPQVSAAEMWGSDVDRLALIRYLTAHKFNTSQPGETEMTNEMTIRLLSRLLSMKLEDFPATELASYVSAFLVTCVNPRNFYGHNIIQELRNRVDKENYTNPYVLLALCNAGEIITESDKKKLEETFENKHRTVWTGMQAVVVMALACANRQSENEVDSEKLRVMTLELKQQQYRNGTVVDLPTTALVMQALIAAGAESDPDNFDEKKAFKEILRNQKSDGSFGDSMSTFLVAPVLTCQSLVDIHSNHCKTERGDETLALENLSMKSGPKIRVQYSLWIGESKDLERNLVLRVPEYTSLYGAMEIAAQVDHRFEFEYIVKNSKPYISAISGMRDNPLRGLFWFMYTVQNDVPTLLNKSPADVVPADNDHFVLWYRSGSWIDCGENKESVKETLTNETHVDSDTSI